MERKRYSSRQRVQVTRSPRLFRRLVVGMLFFTMLALIYIWQREFIKAEVLRIEGLEKTIQKIVEQNKRLQAKQIALSSAERIRRYATEKLDMDEPIVEPIILFYDDRLPQEILPKSLPPKQDILKANPELLAQLFHK